MTIRLMSYAGLPHMCNYLLCYLFKPVRTTALFGPTLAPYSSPHRISRNATHHNLLVLLV